MYDTRCKLKNEEKERRFLAHRKVKVIDKKKDAKPTCTSFSLSNNIAGSAVGLDSASIIKHNLYQTCFWSLLCIADAFTMYFQLQVFPLSSLKIRSEE